MSQAITLLLGVHAHQPVGNFPEVIADAHVRCYRPFIHTLYAYPDFRFAAHFSGWLLDWLNEHYPEDMTLLMTMVQRGQVELFGSGDTEPVLAAIPHHDRLGQLNCLSDKLAQQGGVRPGGAWLTERVWESAVVPALADAGIRYVTVDDYHFFCTGKRDDELDGFFSTEEDGKRLDLFPISETLRYRLPFSPAHEVVGYLEGLADAGHSAAIYFDDIEKFGIWPETFDWVYTRGWLKAFIEGILASPKIVTRTYADYHRAHATRGVVYLPTTSYSEMNEWTLPMPAASDYAALLRQEKTAGRLARNRPFLRGGIWRNFLSRYAEANWMHKRMLGLSQRLAALPAVPPALTARLYRAQANDAYWHGLFGGLYLPHLRRAVWHNILALEAELDRLAPRPATICTDLDLDGHDEWQLHNAALQLVLRDDGLGAAVELSSYLLAHNFGDTLRRYSEHYHGKIAAAPGDGQGQHGEGIASAHDIVRCKEPIGAADLLPDTLPRSLFIDTLDDAALADYGPLQATTDGLCCKRPQVEKTIALTADGLSVSWHLTHLAWHRFATRLDIAMPSCDGFLGRYRLTDDSIPCGFGSRLERPDAQCIILEDAVLGGRLCLAWNLPAQLTAQAHRTVSQSEAGFEKIMQSVETTLAWIVPGEDCTLTLNITIERQG